MEYVPPLIKATLLRRYKRFLADVALDDGKIITVHCPNTGSMRNCIVENADCYLFDSANPKRKYRYTWELATTPDRGLAVINTARANRIIEEAILSGVIPELEGYGSLHRERAYGDEGSRIDLLLEEGDRQCYVEVKSVTLGEPDGSGRFPDAKSDRACKHLRELISVVEKGQRAVLMFCVQHTGIQSVAPADDIDPRYGKLLREAIASGVEVLAYKSLISSCSLKVDKRLPLIV